LVGTFELLQGKVGQEYSEEKLHGDTKSTVPLDSRDSLQPI